ncbi:MAG: helix-turn-helix domain-containing protein [Pseudonocardiaceae bacterium]
MTVRQEPPELVVQKRALGRQLAALREAAEIGQQQVAHKTGYSRSSVAKAEAGRQLLTREFWQTADELLQADGALLASYEQVRAAEQEHDRRSREAELAQAYAEAQALRATTTPDPIQDDGGLVVPPGQEVLARLVRSVGMELAGGMAGPLVYLAFLSNLAQAVPAEWRDQLYEQFAKFLHGWADKMNRRELHQLLGWLAAAVAAFPVSSVNTDEQERFTKAIAAPGRVDGHVIDHIEVMFQHCKRQNDALGAQAVLHTVLAQRQLVGSLLDECPAELRPRLLSVYSSMSSSVGFYFFDLDDAASAMHYCDQARATAQEARNTELAVYALCCMSNFASRQGKAHAGLDFAAAAHSLVDKTDDVLLQVCAAERAGLAYAVDGQYKECMIEFDRALAGFESSAGRISPESPAYYYHEGIIHSQQSDCLLQLGKPVEAAVSASRGLRLIDNSFVGNLAFCALRLGTAHLHSGEVEEAVRLMGDGARLATRYRTARLTKEVRTTRARLQPWQDTPAVKALDEQLAGMGFGT